MSTSVRRPMRRPVVLAAMLVAAAALAACGSEEADSPQPTPAPVAAPGDAAALVVQTQDRQFTTNIGIWARYDDTKGTPLELGPPADDAKDEAAGGKSMPFAQGTVFWSQATGAKVVRGAVLTTYLDLGGPGGKLGYPISDETVDGEETFSDFEHGRIALAAGEMTVTYTE